MNKKFGWNVKVVNLNEEAKENQKLELEKEGQDNAQKSTSQPF